jgi:hypothetical protein
MDPISATASLLTILGTAGGSIKSIHQLVLDYKDAPAEIQNYKIHLECLQHTVTRLIHVHEALPTTYQFDAHVAKCVIELMDEISSVQSLLERRSISMSESRGHRIRESLRWLLLDRRVKKFFTQVEHWNRVLANAAAASQM